jgi:hypothetical protein
MDDCDALANFARDVAATTQNATQFVQDLSVLIPETFLDSLPLVGLKWWTSSPVILNTGQASGYQAEYQNTLPDHPELGPVLGNGDQGHHFAAYLEFGFQYGGAAGDIGSYLGELLQSVGSGNLNQGDILLGRVAANIGAALKNGLSPIDSILDISSLCKH